MTLLSFELEDLTPKLTPSRIRDLAGGGPIVAMYPDETGLSVTNFDQKNGREFL